MPPLINEFELNVPPQNTTRLICAITLILVGKILECAPSNNLGFDSNFRIQKSQMCSLKTRNIEKLSLSEKQTRKRLNDLS